MTVAIDNSGAFRSADHPAGIALRTVVLLRKELDVDCFSQRPLVGDAEAVGCDSLDEAVSGLDRELAIAIDQARLAVDIDLGKTEFVIADEAIARRHDLVPVVVDEAIEATNAYGGSLIGERADPVVAWRYRNAPVTPHCAAETASECAHRHRKDGWSGRPTAIVERSAVTRDNCLKDASAGRGQRR
nr:hypothetical protein [Bradyrhizobium sp. BR 10261]